LTLVTATRLEQASLRTLNTFGIDACARELWRLERLSDLPRTLAQLHANSHGRPLVLGGGSNLLIAGDLDQAVLHIRLKGRRVLREESDTLIIEAAAGESWDELVHWSLACGAQGLENLALIPGTVGAAPIQNIGAYGVELRDVFDSLDAVDIARGQWHQFDAAEAAFAYRDSLFKQQAGRWLVTAVRFRLSRTPRLRLDYGDIGEELRRMKVSQPSPAQVAQAVSAIRRRRLPDPAVLGNAGSFFKNPIVPAAQARALAAREPGLPSWPGTTGFTKLSAAWMIDRCGWKGHRSGDAGVHADHALVLVNHGHASGADILALAHRIQASVAARFDVTLEPEPIVVGQGHTRAAPEPVEPRTL
jgi:UDP-N-acetylmuramate dehydrogenase